MTRHLAASSIRIAVPIRIALFGAVFASALAAVAGCSEDAATVRCPPVPLYDNREQSPLNDRELARRLGAAADAGCVTLPVPPEGAAGASP